MRTGALLFAAACVLAGPTSITFAQSAESPTVLYTLQPGSTFEEGCYNQCLCPILQAPLQGTFGLELLPTMGPLNTYRFDPIDFLIPALNKMISGSGFYVPAGELNQLELNLEIDGAPAELFSSGGFVPAGAEFPEIDIVVSMNQFQSCFDRSFHIVASPFVDPYPGLVVADSELTWDAIDGADRYDVVCGDLGYLRSSAGDFTGSTDLCLEAGYTGTTTPYDLTPGVAEGVWFLVRGEGGSYDAVSDNQVEPRSAEIDSSPLACP